VYSFLEKLIEVDCGENRRLLIHAKSKSEIASRETNFAQDDEGKKYFRRVTDSPARYRMNWREALSASKPRVWRRRSMFNVKSERRKTSMKIKTNVKAGSPTLPLPPPRR
jgi:hypothetical protein